MLSKYFVSKLGVSLTCNTVDSQPSTVPEPTFQIDPRQNPEEFFAAFEKFESTLFFSNLWLFVI